VVYKFPSPIRDVRDFLDGLQFYTKVSVYLPTKVVGESTDFGVFGIEHIFDVPQFIVITRFVLLEILPITTRGENLLDGHDVLLI
jgi:hypothetical protein